MQLFNFGMKTGLINCRLHSSQLSWTVNSAVKPISYHIVRVFVLFPVFSLLRSIINLSLQLAWAAVLL